MIIINTKSAFKHPLFLLLLGIMVFTCGCSSNSGIATRTKPVISDTVANKTSELSICSFNIQFLGNYKNKDNDTLAKILKDYDIVVVQELVAPPVNGTYPDGDSYIADPESAQFLQAMQSEGFSYLLSEEDTGTNDNIHLASTATEWWITFYKPESVHEGVDLPHGFLSDDRSNNDNYERVPYAFPFRTFYSHLDFVLISVHLQPGDSGSEQERRKEELVAISEWINSHNQTEKDFLIVGDMNIKDKQELLAITPLNMVSLNSECRSTNTNPTSPKPYDQVMYFPEYTTEIDKEWGLGIVNLIDAVKPYWNREEVFPGDPYNHNQFRQYYSDHNPVVFKMNVSERDDD